MYHLSLYRNVVFPHDLSLPSPIPYVLFIHPPNSIGMCCHMERSRSDNHGILLPPPITPSYIISRSNCSSSSSPLVVAATHRHCGVTQMLLPDIQRSRETIALEAAVHCEQSRYTKNCSEVTSQWGAYHV